MSASQPLTLGLLANWRQFALLMVVNAFVGAMLGLERTVVPLIAANEFDLTSVSVTLTFIVSFGIVKALANLYAGRSADRIGRKPLLVAGWLIGLPVPLIIIFAPSWGWIVFANILLGVNQGLCWSAAVIMKVDLGGPVGRGRATGLNEFAGYLAMALSTTFAGWLAAQTALRPYPFYLGIIFAVSGLTLSVFFVRETRAYAMQEASQHQALAEKPAFWAIFRRVSWQDRAFFSLSQGGLVNNLNDVVIWGLLPLLAVSTGVSVAEAAAVGGTYLGVWGISQLFTGALSDRIGRKPLVTGGLWVQSLGIALLVFGADSSAWLLAAVMMGIGTGMVYPTLLAAISDLAHPSWRASALGVYRLWRDSGYAFGALVGGLLADLFTIQVAILVIAALTAVSGAVTFVLLPETLVKHQRLDVLSIPLLEPAVEPPSIGNTLTGMMNAAADLENKVYDIPSVFMAENLLREARRQKAIAEGSVPTVCILDPDGDIAAHLIATGQAAVHQHWACYHTKLYAFHHNGIEYGIIPHVVGASFAVLVAEELFVSGCKLLISMTSAGQIVTMGQPPYFVLIEKALRDEGTSYHYLPPAPYSQIDPILLTCLEDAFADVSVRVLRGATWTTDAPFRETEHAITYARSEGILGVEMEAAALYAFAQVKGKSVVCFAHITNQMAQIEGDFEKGLDQGSHDALEVIRFTAQQWLSHIPH